MKVLVTGATSMIGDYLLPKLVQDGHEVLALSRSDKPADQATSIQWIKGDLSCPDSLGLLQSSVDAWINLASVALLSNAMTVLCERIDVKRVLAFSSTSRYTKAASSSQDERDVAVSLARAEDEVSAFCKSRSIYWTLFRPTLIYCRGRDRNLSVIENTINRFGFFPLIGRGVGLRQPVHASDLAEACRLALASEASRNKAYNLSGGETLSYREMVARIFQSLDKTPRLPTLQPVLFRTAIRILRHIPAYRYLTPDMADRIAVDIIFPHDQATADFGYSPRPFDYH